MRDNGNPFGRLGIPDAPANAPSEAAAVQIRDFDRDTLQFTVTGTNGADGDVLGSDPAATVSQQGRGAVISIGDVTVTLEGVGAGDLIAENFLGASLASTESASEPDEIGSALASLVPEDGLVG